jgi:Domain of unknown function (DUF4430)
MPKLHSLAALVAASVVLCCATAASAAPVTVNLRVEGSTQTLFEGPVTTDAKSLTKDSSGSHPCDGTNGGTNPTPGPTMTGALDDGSIAAGFTWDATWNDGFQDFFINSIGSDANTGAPTYQPYWGYFLNGVATQIGGCQQQVAQGDNVLFAYGNFGQPLLELSAPAKAATGESFTATVQQNDGNGNRTPAAGATVDGHMTDAAGHATFSYSDPGNHKFKATRADAIRSNAATVCVYTPGSGGCGTEKAPGDQTPPAEQPALEPQITPAAKDTTPPVIHITSPESGKDYDKGPRLLTGTVDEAGGIAQVFLRLRLINHGPVSSKNACRWFSGKRAVFTHRTVPCERSRFFRIGTSAKWSYLLPARLGKGSYVLDVKVLDKAYNAGRGSAPFGVR